MKIASVPFDMNEISAKSDSYQISPEFSKYPRTTKALAEIAQGRDAILVVNTGQSNAYGSNHDGVLPSDFEVNNNVYAWDKNARNFRKSEPRFYQLDGERLPTMVSYAHAFCVRLQKETGKKIYYVQLAYGSKSIVNWTNDRTDPSIFKWDIGAPLISHINSAVQQLAQYGVEAPDIWTFFQGEDDAGRPHDWYAAQFKKMVKRFHDAGVMYPGVTPFLCGEMLKGGYGEPMRDFYRNMHRHGINYATVVSTDGLDNDGVSRVHLSGPSYWKFGYERLFQALVDEISTRNKIVRCDMAHVPPASIVPDSMIVRVDDATQPYIAFSDGAQMKKANIS